LARRIIKYWFLTNIVISKTQNNFYYPEDFRLSVNLKEFLSTLPQSVIKGEEILLPDHLIRKIFSFGGLNEHDIFYDLGCGINNTVAIASKEFNVKRSVGIEIKRTRCFEARKKIVDLKNAEIINKDIRKTDLSEATVLFFWFTDSKMIQQMVRKFDKELKNNARIITLWSPLNMMLPSQIEFPFFVCKKPFSYAKNIRDQIQVIYGNSCIDFTASWLLAEKYIDTLNVVPGQYRRFVNILQSMIIWINAWNMGIACEEEIPPPVESYIGILKTFFDIDLSNNILKNPLSNTHNSII